MMLTAAIVTFPLRQPVAIFLLVLAIILTAPLIFNRLKIPHIVGMIIAGIMVGPYGFNLLARDASFEIFGQVGILYLMFLAAVEIDMFHLRQNSRRGVIFGLLTFILPMAGGVAASRWAFAAPWETCVLIASMYASHTLVSYPIVNRFGLQNARPVVVTICGTIVAVMLALMALAQVLADRGDTGSLASDVWTLLMLTAVYVVAVGFGIPYATRLFFRKVSEPVTQFIYVLAMVFVASLLAQIIGLEAILGAFYAGLVLNRYIPSRSGLMNRIEFVGNAIFIPYFLIGVGMLINVRVIFQGWGVAWVALNMVATALSLKWLAAWLSQKLFGYTAVERRMMFGLSSGKAAATIAATMLGFQYGLLDEDQMNGAVLMILVCCAIASIVTERSAKKLRMERTEEDLKSVSRQQRRNARQVVAVANPMTAEGIMKQALLMRHQQNQLPVTALFVRSNDDSRVMAMGRSALRLATGAAIAADIEVNDVERFDINIVSGIINVSKESDASEIVIGLHRKSNIVDTFYGSMIEQMLRTSNKMIVMSRCFIPVNTVRRLVVIVPAKAEYETGFRMWVERVCNMASQLGCRVLIMAYADTIPYIQGVITAEKYSIRTEYITLESWDDFITSSAIIQADDLMVVIGARRTSISFSPDLEMLPTYLGRYFADYNLMVVYPEQFGANEEMPVPIDPLAQSIQGGTGGFSLTLHRLRDIYYRRRTERRRREFRNR